MGSGIDREAVSSNAGVLEEAVQALVALGFKPKESEQAAIKVIRDGEDADSSAVIRKALGLLKN